MTTTSAAHWADDLDREVSPWKPREDGQPDRVVGVLKAIDTFDGGHGPYKVLTVEAEDGQSWSVHAFHEGLKRELRRERPQVGQRFGVRYLGRKDLAGGNTFERYKVVVDRPATPAPVEDWSTEVADKTEDDALADPGSQVWAAHDDQDIPLPPEPPAEPPF